MHVAREMERAGLKIPLLIGQEESWSSSVIFMSLAASFFLLDAFSPLLHPRRSNHQQATHCSQDCSQILGACHSCPRRFKVPRISSLTLRSTYFRSVVVCSSLLDASSKETYVEEIAEEYEEVRELTRIASHHL